ncbi:response regulator [Serratia marcescens]|nr:response regulator [Serratia marcescens]MDP8628813.1 response regulator [Serratia marcescens]
MTKYSLRARMMILILAPTLLIGLLLSTFFVVHRYNELQEQLVDAGASIIEPLAVASEYGMTFRSRESVRQLVSLLHRRHSDIVRSITVFDAQNNLFVTSNYHHNFAQLQLPKGVPLPTELMLTRRGDSLILRTPILSESQYPDETADGGSHPDNNLGYVAIELDLQSVRLQQYKEVFVSTLLLLLCMCIATETGNIDIRVELRKQLDRRVEVEVQIHDTGIGISERQQSQLFQAFRQADASISRRHGGTGLGLVITQKLVKEMGGDICFHSQLNRGSTFWFHITLDLNEGMLSLAPSLPDLSGKTLAYIESNPTAAQATLNMLSITQLVITHSPTLGQLPPGHYDFLLAGVPIPFRDNMAQHEDKLLASLKLADRVILALPCQAQIDAELLKQQGALGCLIKPITSTRLFPLLRMEAPARLTAQPERKRLPLTVMAVDDNPANLKLIGTLLGEQVEKTLLCESGEEALALARDNVLDLILMDIQMPKMDGIHASELIRQLPHHNSTPIVAVTAHAASGEREHLLQAGMDDYLAKPIDEKMLTRVLSRYHSGDVENAIADDAPLSLDWPLALRQAANKPDLARDLLQMLLDFLPQVRERVQALLDGQHDDEILDLVHKLHGSCSYSGVPRLKQLCFYLERQLRQGITNDELEPEWLELLDEIELVIHAARAHLAQPA